MRSCERLQVLLVLSLLSLSGSIESAYAEPETPDGETPLEGFRIERIEQKRTDEIAWMRIQVVADRGSEATWAVLQNIEEWSHFLRIFSQITPVERARTMTRYQLYVSPPWPLGDFVSTVWIAKLPDQRLMLWRADRETLTNSHGRVEVKQIAGGTRVIYEFQSPARKAFPPWVVRIGLYLVLPGIAKDFYDRIDERD